jgi:membrane glycosyltransferase
MHSIQQIHSLQVLATNMSDWTFRLAATARKEVDWAPLQRSAESLWKQVKTLFAEHHFLTILCAFFAVMMVLAFYRFLKSISPALVYFVLLLILAILILHWTQTRTEPTFMKPFIDWLAPFFPDVSDLPPAQPTKRS